MDVIGVDFDFVNDPAKISLTANGEKLAPEKIDDATYGFGKLADGSYRFTLGYVDGDQEKLVLMLNEAASPSRPLVLEYSERLVNVPTEPGTHTLNVNESAFLNPVDANGVSGESYEFPVPTVTYTVPEPEQKPEDTTKPSADNAKKPAKKAKGGVPKTGDATTPTAAVGLLVAGVAAGTVGVAVRRRNR